MLNFIIFSGKSANSALLIRSGGSALFQVACPVNTDRICMSHLHLLIVSRRFRCRDWSITRITEKRWLRMKYFLVVHTFSSFWLLRVRVLRSIIAREALASRGIPYYRDQPNHALWVFANLLSDDQGKCRSVEIARGAFHPSSSYKREMTCETLLRALCLQYNFLPLDHSSCGYE